MHFRVSPCFDFHFSFPVLIYVNLQHLLAILSGADSKNMIFFTALRFFVREEVVEDGSYTVWNDCLVYAGALFYNNHRIRGDKAINLIERDFQVHEKWHQLSVMHDICK